jgi:outer membrane protein assembly factor BamB
MKTSPLAGWFLCAVLLPAAIVQAADDANSILSATDTTGGLVVHLDCGDGRLTAQLCRGESFLVRGLDTDPQQRDRARETVQQSGRYGQVSFDLYDGRTLPFVDNLVTLVVAEQSSVPTDEIMRVLHPHGAAYIDGQVHVKPLPASIDQWTHYLHDADNNAVAHDSLVGPPRHMQFLAAPLWARHHDRLASLSTVVTAQGRMFYIVDNGPVFDPDEAAQWTVTARNAFNGTFLWQQAISSWTDHMRGFRSGPVQLQRLLVTDGDRVFVPRGLDQPVSVLDAATGRETLVLNGTQQAEELLLYDDVLFVLIGRDGAEQALIERRNDKSVDFKSKLLKAIDTRSNTVLWQWPADGAAEIMPRTPAVAAGGVFFQAASDTVCLDAATGVERWRTSLHPAGQETTDAAGQRGQNKKKAKGSNDPTGRKIGWTFATLVVQDGVVLSCDGRTLWALDALSGSQLWDCPAATPFGRTPSVDILVVDGVVWTSPDLNQGRDLRTGQSVSANNLSEELVTAGHHHRCYRNKATDRYLIQGYRGLEFRDTQGDDHCRHNWIRGICQYGIMPANGMVYLPPHNCGCYPEAKLYGLWALKAGESSFDTADLQTSTLLERGPASDQIHTANSSASAPSATDWPMHRHDPRRSGVLASGISAEQMAWQTELPGRLTAPVVANGTLLVCNVATHQVCALDAATGQRRWEFTAGGPVDSPPTIHRETALFGSADGYVYCLRLSDGALVWRFRGAPAAAQTVALQQVESLWPIHGSVLVVDDTAYFVAGRSSHIDGGLFLYGLDARSGDVRFTRRLPSPPAPAMADPGDVQREGFSQNAVDYKTRLSPDQSDAFSMSGNLSDILVADQDAIYLRHQKFDRQLNPRDEWTHHLFSTSRLLDDTESYRAHWFYGNGDFSRLPVAYEWLTRGSYGGFSTPLGKFLVFDDQTLWGSGWKRLVLYKTDIANIDQRLEKDFPQDQGNISHQLLAESLPIHPRSMLKAADRLYLAGYPADSTIAHFSGRPIEDRGILIQVDAATGEILSQIELPASPVFDGMAAAAGRLYLSLENSSVMCLQ